MMNNYSNGNMQALTKTAEARSARVSSYDHSGKNQDYWMIPPCESITLGEIDGPGCITHIWMTSFCRKIMGPSIVDPVLGSNVAPANEIHNALGITWEEQDPFYYRKALIKITWDDQDTPSVLAPLGDFFCVGHSLPGNFESMPFNVSVKPEEAGKFGAPCALNCFFPMPFNKKAKIEIINENELPFALYFYVDYELYKEELPEETVYFHANWKRNNPNNGWGNGLQTNSPDVQGISNLSGEDNYVLLETEGKGHYVGCNLSVNHFQGSWWGEGDDMIFIDGEEMPSINGTGTEDYFSFAWGMQKNHFLYNGTIIHEGDMPGYTVAYRFHIADPIHFSEKIKVTIEHGHANHLSDDWSSTAYWYQTIPSPTLNILPVEERLPIVATLSKPVQKETPALTVEQEQAFADAKAREDYYRSEKEKQMKLKYKKTHHAMKENLEDIQRVKNTL